MFMDFKTDKRLIPMKHLLTLILLLLFFSCNVTEPTYVDYNRVEVTRIQLNQFPALNSSENAWDDESDPDLYVVIREGNDLLVYSSMIIEVQQSDLPLDLYFPDNLITDYFYKDMEIFLYDNDEASEDDLIGRTDIFCFGDAIINHQYNESIELENDNNLNIKVFFHWKN